MSCPACSFPSNVAIERPAATVKQVQDQWQHQYGDGRVLSVNNKATQDQLMARDPSLPASSLEDILSKSWWHLWCHLCEGYTAKPIFVLNSGATKICFECVLLLNRSIPPDGR